MLKNITFFLILTFCLLGGASLAVYSQPPNGQSPSKEERNKTLKKAPEKPVPKKPVKANTSSNDPRVPRSRPAARGQTSRQPAECLESEILIRCDLPECNVLLD